MMRRCRANAARLWRDERGQAGPAFLILCTTIIALGGLVGLSSVRDQITQQLGDIAVALDHVSQSFSYTVVVNGDTVEDVAYVDPGASLSDPANGPPACLVFTAATGNEGTTVTAPPGTVP